MSECMQLRIVSCIPEILQAFLLDARKRNLKERKVGVITKCLIYFSTYKVTLYIPAAYLEQLQQCLVCDPGN
jgi:hypothetical protein